MAIEFKGEVHEKVKKFFEEPGKKEKVNKMFDLGELPEPEKIGAINKYIEGMKLEEDEKFIEGSAELKELADKLTEISGFEDMGRPLVRNLVSRLMSERMNGEKEALDKLTTPEEIENLLTTIDMVKKE